jgi:hypothetical protein
MHLLWLATSAHALKYEDTQLEMVHGWTADGALVLEITTHVALRRPNHYDDPSPARGTLRYAVVQRGDAVVQRWLLSKELPSHATNDEPLQVDAWTGWRNANPLVPAPPSRSAPGGVRLEVRPTEGVRSEWRGASVQIVGSCETDAPDPVATFALSNGGEGSWPLHRQPTKAALAQEPIELTGSGRWSADGRRVALIVERPELPTMWALWLPELDVVLSLATPLIGVLAPASLEAAAVDRVDAALRDLGLIQRAPAKAERQVSVVYAASGYEADAAVIASRIPGGATVEPLSWRATQHVVVAVGTSAARP